MTHYSYSQLQALWLNNSQGTKYNTQPWAALMAAIAEAESGGDTGSLNLTDNGGTQTSWGLWQISNGTHSQPVNNILDPNVNAQQAIQKLNTQGLSAWGTYDSGAYRQFLNGASTPDFSGVGTGASTTAASGNSDCLISLPGSNLPLIGSSIPCLLSKSEARGAVGGLFLLLGGGVALVGVLILAAYAFERSGAGRAATRAVGYIPGASIIAGGITAVQGEAQTVRGPGRQVSDTRGRGPAREERTAESESEGRPAARPRRVSRRELIAANDEAASEAG
jgi:hypothetical protein